MSTLLQEPSPAIPTSRSEPAAVRVVFSRWLSVLLAVAIVVPWLVLVGLLASRNMASGNSKVTEN